MVKDVMIIGRQVTIPAVGGKLTLVAPPIIGMDNENMLEIIWEPSSIQITIPEGSYTAENLAKTIESLMNKEVYLIFLLTQNIICFL